MDYNLMKLFFDDQNRSSRSSRNFWEQPQDFPKTIVFGSLGISVIGPRFGGVSVHPQAHTPKSGVSPQEFPETIVFVKKQQKSG
jgi:hypothetical protein